MKEYEFLGWKAVLVGTIAIFLTLFSIAVALGYPLMLARFGLREYNFLNYTPSPLFMLSIIYNSIAICWVSAAITNSCLLGEPFTLGLGYDQCDCKFCKGGSNG